MHLIKSLVRVIRMLPVEDQFIKIPPGSLEMRDDRKGKVWTAQISPFLISQYQVTQDLYTFVTGENPSAFRELKNPVENVSWMDTVKFCNKLSDISGLKCSYEINEDVAILIKNANGYRLPTESEWEYACKAGTKKPRYGELKEIAWYEKNSSGSPHTVGLKKPNDWGLYDMLGNVWEWCEDLYDEEVYGTYRVFRGGGWNDHERGCLATNRRRSMQSFRIDDLGFRLARTHF